MLTTNLTLTLADTQYSHTLAGTTRRWSVQCRTAYDVRMCEVTGKVAGPTAPWSTIKSGGAFNDGRNTDGPQTIYFASSQAGVILEIVEFTV